jgi:hypothetical protein
MPVPRARYEPVCEFCGVSINPIMARYLFLAWGWRGRAMAGGTKTHKHTFCGPCADQVLHSFAPYLASVWNVELVRPD